jgi:hypothetical protein
MDDMGGGGNKEGRWAFMEDKTLSVLSSINAQNLVE